MTPVFAEASYYVAVSSPRDQYHQAAVRVSGQLRQPSVVSEFVLIEVSNALSATGSRGRAMALWSHLKNDTSVTIVPASEELVAKGVKLYSNRFDEEWSLTDCISFVIMEERGLTKALPADRHFEQAGFSAMLLP